MLDTLADLAGCALALAAAAVLVTLAAPERAPRNRRRPPTTVAVTPAPRNRRVATASESGVRLVTRKNVKRPRAAGEV